VFKKILHEPLVHFLVLGALVFVLYSALNGDKDNHENIIVISKADQKQLAYRWQKKHMRAPTADEISAYLKELRE